MNRFTEWFLKQKALHIFLLSFLAIPIYLWLFSIIYQLDKKRSYSKNFLKTVIVALITVYPIVYIFVFFVVFFNLIGGNRFNILDSILPFHIATMLCGFLLMLFGAISYAKYEKEKGIKTYDSVGVFFMIWFYIIGVWIIQPNLNKYVKE